MISPLLIIIVIAVGVLIGGVGIGGVLLVPSLKFLGGISLHSAIPACMFSYIFSGVVGTWIYTRQGTINLSMAYRIGVGALPGAYIGSFLLPYLSAQLLEFGIGMLVLASGFYALSGSQKNDPGVKTPGTMSLMLIGMVTGIGSALSGTGGPLLLIPILLWCKVPVLVAIGLSQVVQIPIALTATAGNLIHGDVNLELGLVLAFAVGGGALVGAKTVHLLPVNLIKRVVACLLVLVGIMMLYRLIFT
jgi:uncharacterized membrane protein YfcA